MNIEADRDLDRLLHEIGKLWPDHAVRLASAHEALSANAKTAARLNATAICNVHGDRLSEIVKNYKETCEVILGEELYFRRTGTYRASNVSDANDIIAAMPGFWSRYFDGLLLTQVFWTNHVEAFALLKSMVVDQRPKHVLEIGPGHGLIISSISKELPNSECTAWDINRSAIDATQAFAAAMGVDHKVRAHLRDVSAPPPNKVEAFDSIVLFEVLEHVDDPVEMLRHVSRFLSPHALVYVSIPINSPAPDHVGLYRSQDAIETMASKAGFSIVESSLFPQTGYSLKRAIRTDATISYVAAWRECKDR